MGRLLGPWWLFGSVFVVGAHRAALCAPPEDRGMRAELCGCDADGGAEPLAKYGATLGATVTAPEIASEFLPIAGQQSSVVGGNKRWCEEPEAPRAPTLHPSSSGSRRDIPLHPPSLPR